MDDTKLHAKNEKELETLIKTIRIYCQHIGREFDDENLSMLMMKSRKRETTEKIELPNKESIGKLGGMENYKYLEILQTNTIK